MVQLVDGKTLKQWMDAGERMALVDGRAEEDHDVDHLPGAVSLLNAEVEKKADLMIPKGVKVVVYSNDAECSASGLVAGKLDRMGFGSVYDYNDSYKDWVSNRLDRWLHRGYQRRNGRDLATGPCGYSCQDRSLRKVSIYFFISELQTIVLNSQMIFR